MSFNVTVIDVREEEGMGAKGTYNYTLFEYDYQGETRSAKIFSSAFKKYAGLKASLAKLKKGMNVALDMEANDKGFKELAKITIGDQNHAPTKTTSNAAPAKTSTGTAKPTGYDNLGQQIGNSITNAVNSLGVGKTTNDYKTRAVEFIVMGDQIRDLVNSGSLEKMLAQDEQPNESYADLNPEEDIPF